jgi:hypothetical protein
MINDAVKWNVGITKLGGFMQFRRPPFEEDAVAELNGIITLLEEASEEDLSHFKIPPDKLKPRVISAQRISYSGRPGRVQYADKKYCEEDYFRSQLASLAGYVKLIRGHKTMDRANPYDALPDYQLEEMMINRKLKPKRVIDGRGEQWVWDRAHAIAELMKSDNPTAPPSVSNVFNINDSNFIHSSPGASITQTLASKNEELQKLLAELKQFSAATGLPPESRSQINVDIGTIELHLNSSRPNPSIIRASLDSARAIAENTAGTVLGAGVIVAIKHYLGIP